MKRLIAALLTGITMALLLPMTVAAANLNNFTILDYRIDYVLGRDDSRQSTLRTTETITANFPPNQNRGIERAVPLNYDGHTVDLEIVSVKDPRGSDLQYSTYTSRGNSVIRIGDPDSYVSGVKTYVITYDQTNVTKNFFDRDEFYWDTNGTDWQVPIQALSVNLRFESTLGDDYTGQSSCYIGKQGSEQTCQLAEANGQFSVQATGLAAGENITLALGFEPDSFAEYQMPLWLKLFIGWVFLQIVLGVVSIGLIIWLTVRYYRSKQRSREHDPIAPEYLPPSDASIEVSAKLLSSSLKTFPAQIIDLAVRRYLQIREVKPKTTFKPAEYELEIIKPVDDLRAEEAEFLSDLFADEISVGAKLNMKTLQNNTAVYQRFSDNPKKTRALVRGQYGLRHQVPEQTGWFRKVSLRLLVVGLLLLSPALLLVALISYVQSRVLWPLTDKGLSLVRYLKGLKMYIKVGEAERLKMLQSPEGAQKVGNANDTSQLIKLYERGLPYAVLFGVEKDWNKQLGRYYEQANSQPDWYSGYSGAVFTGAAFSSAMSSFQTTSNYSSHSSSSSSGSSGGGFSGGGGGGGGGGGW